MGLGKTVEVLALILGNPSISTPRTSRSDERENESLVETKATLIVVPQTLIGKLRDKSNFYYLNL